MVVGTNLALTAATTFALYSAINLMWMLVIGTAGIFSLATLAVVGASAYLTAWLSIEFGITWPVMLLLGTLIGLLFGAIIGLPALRIDGLYFALLTMGVVELCRVYVVQSKTFGSATGGLYGADTFIPGGLAVEDAGIDAGLCRSLRAHAGDARHIPAGQRRNGSVCCWRLPRESEASAEALGINYQMARFHPCFLIRPRRSALSADFYAAYFKGASPSLFSIDQVMLLFRHDRHRRIWGVPKAPWWEPVLLSCWTNCSPNSAPIRLIAIGLIMLGVTLFARNGLLGIRAAVH